MPEHVCNMVIEEGGVVLDFEDGLYPAHCTICGRQDYVARHVCEFVLDTSMVLMSQPPQYKETCSCGRTIYAYERDKNALLSIATAKP